MVELKDIQNILGNLNSFTKEELEILNNYQVKSLAQYDIKKYDLLKNTSPRFFQANIIMSKYSDIALKHKEMVINTTFEHLNIHKEIILQLLSILQSLVQNPNLLDTLMNLINSEWYSGQDFKQFICDLINKEMINLNNLYAQLLILNNQPLICFIPEIFNSEFDSLDSTKLEDFYSTLENNYILEP